MRKKTVRFYSKSELNRLLGIGNLPKESHKEALEEFSTTQGRTFWGVYAKFHSLLKKTPPMRMKRNPREIEIYFTSVKIDMESNKITFSLP